MYVLLVVMRALVCPAGCHHGIWLRTRAAVEGTPNIGSGSLLEERPVCPPSNKGLVGKI